MTQVFVILTVFGVITQAREENELFLTSVKLILFVKLVSGRQQELLFRAFWSGQNYCRRTDWICLGKA